MTSPSEAAPAVRIDARGLKCPWPVLRAAKAMRAHRAIELLADDPVALTDVPALAEARGWVVGVSHLDGLFTFTLRAGAGQNGH